MLLPVTCLTCGTASTRLATESAGGSALCVSCRVGLEPPPAGSPFPALVAYDGVGRDIVTALKFRGGRRIVPVLADALTALAVEQLGHRGPAAGSSTQARFGVVTWAPTGAARRRARGFDQAEILARAVARRLGVRCRRLLLRVDDGAHQTGRSRRERLAGPTFVALGRVPPDVLVVDDVVTTGATLSAARSALQLGGARRVVCVAVAATSPSGPTHVVARRPARSGPTLATKAVRPETAPDPLTYSQDAGGRHPPAPTGRWSDTDRIGGARGCHGELPEHRPVA